jgi:hypothetical protein
MAAQDVFIEYACAQTFKISGFGTGWDGLNRFWAGGKQR